MGGAIEVRGFMGLVDVFRERQWSMPHVVEIEVGLTGNELLTRLDIAAEKVEILFINGKAWTPQEAVICPGDRVALVPPGTPGPYRVLLGFVKKE